MKPPLIILAGPTAAGKTALSVTLAEQINGSVISADSMQVYRYMDRFRENQDRRDAEYSALSDRRTASGRRI